MLVAVGLVVLVGGASCSGSDDSGAGDGGSTGAGGSNAVAAQPALDGRRGLMYTGTDELRPGGANALAPVGPSVIKTAQVSVRVRAGDLHSSIQDLVAVARDNQGFVLSTSVLDEAGHRGEVVLRVPADRFEAALSEAERVGDVTREQVSGEDVGQEFVDLEARLRNFESQETVLLRLMSRSTSVADTLRVQRELQDVQLEIERLRGRIRYLKDQTDLSTITVNLSEAGATVASTSTIERAWHRAVDTFNAIVSGTVLTLSVAIPLALLLIVALFLGRAVRSRWASWWPHDA
jgi:hypothetical protein